MKTMSFRIPLLVPAFLLLAVCGEGNPGNFIDYDDSYQVNDFGYIVGEW